MSLSSEDRSKLKTIYNELTRMQKEDGDMPFREMSSAGLAANAVIILIKERLEND